MLFKMLDRQGWKESRHNPVKMLKELPQAVLEAASADLKYLHHYDVIMARFHKETRSKVCWFTELMEGQGCMPIAYFSAEYGLHHSLPFYAGGLGFLAGDHLKECSDLGVPIVGVGFMYPEGYLRQRIRVDGWQEHVDEPLERGSAPIQRVLDGQKRQLVVKVPFMDPPVHVAVWEVAVGRVTLYLLDTDIEQNDPWNRSISSHLYAGDLEQRLRQEIVLGIGGSEALAALGIRHTVLHLNEGHPAFAILERIRERVQEGMTFEEASRALSATTVFTTHTPVAAGHDVFPFHLMDRYFGGYYPGLGLDRDAFMQLGTHPRSPDQGFNMTAFALRMSSHRNAVSKRHQEVARHMWQSLWPGVKPEEVPIDVVTNGVHVPTWVDPKVETLFGRYLEPEWLQSHDDPVLWQLIEEIPDRQLWELHVRRKMKLINAVRDRARLRWAENSVDPTNVVAGGVLLDPMTLTLGFARRFATYKRATLLFHDLDRLKHLLLQRWRPVQIIFAGKAHPADDPGKRLLQSVFAFARDPDLAGRIAFVEDYDEQLAQYLTHGVDAWLNTPLPPMEACGTSGMKASINGVPHLSILEGWWIEGYNGANGWAFGDEGHMNEDRDAADASELYALLEHKIVPLYYKVDDDGVPVDWITVMKEAIKTVGPRFSARRMVKEYVGKFYQKALQSAP
jgi:starch phosphorylase